MGRIYEWDLQAILSLLQVANFCSSCCHFVTWAADIVVVEFVFSSLSKISMCNTKPHSNTNKGVPTSSAAFQDQSSCTTGIVNSVCSALLFRCA